MERTPWHAVQIAARALAKKTAVRAARYGDAREAVYSGAEPAWYQQRRVGGETAAA